MKALLLIAHGSRNPEANAEIRRLTDRLAHQIPLAELAFLELAKPSIDEAVTQLIEAGATRIVVLPYFLAAGRHAARDIPHQINQAQTKHPLIDFELIPHLGAFAGVDELILNALKTQN